MVPDERLCSTCLGMGFIQSSDVNNFRCIPCPSRCNISENRLKLKQGSRISGARQEWMLHTAKWHPEQKPYIQELLNLIHAHDPAGFWYLHGPNGVGKTYILIAAVNQAIRTQRSGLYITSIELLDLLRGAAKGLDGPAENRLLHKITNTTVLAIDEMGRERKTEYALEKLFQILSQRHQDATDYDINHPAKLTLLASNYEPRELEPYLQSRLHGPNTKIIDLSNLPDRRAESR